MSKDFDLNIPRVLYQIRYCDQKNFDITVCDYHNDGSTRKVYLTNYPTFKCVKTMYSTQGGHIEEEGGSVSRVDKNPLLSISNVWSQLRQKRLNNTSILEEISGMKRKFPDRRSKFHTCLFMQNIYMLGGYHTCLKYDTTTKNWMRIAKLNIYRRDMGCAVFEGKIVVTGGFHELPEKSVEAYDHHEKKWSYFPEMVNRKFGHKAVSVGNKLFVIGGIKRWFFEVFDSRSRKFTNLKKMIEFEEFGPTYASLVNIGYKIIVIQEIVNEKVRYVNIYDALQDSWSLRENPFKVDFVYSLSRVPSS